MKKLALLTFIMSLFSDNIQLQVNNDQIEHFTNTANRWNKALYLTHSFYADVSHTTGAGRAVFNLAGHGKEEVKVFCNAVQLADVFICTEDIKRDKHFLRRLAASNERGLTFGGPSS